MDKCARHIRILISVLLAAITVFAPVAKNSHTAYHVPDADITGHVVDETCPLCQIEFPAFEETDNTLSINIIEREYCVYVPSIIGNLCNNPIESLVIRGPPEA